MSVVMLYSNNAAKTRRSLKKAGKDKLYEKFKEVFTERANEWRKYFTFTEEGNKMTRYIKKYKKDYLVELKQIWFSPTDKTECWEFKEKSLSFLHRISREISQRGIEIIYTQYITIRYKDLDISFGNNLWSDFNLMNVSNEVGKFFRLVTDYKGEIKKEVKK